MDFDPVVIIPECYRYTCHICLEAGRSAALNSPLPYNDTHCSPAGFSVMKPPPAFGSQNNKNKPLGFDPRSISHE